MELATMAATLSISSIGKIAPPTMPRGRPTRTSLLCLREVLYRKHFAITFDDPDTHDVHIAVEDIGPMPGGFHELGVNERCIGSLSDILVYPHEMRPCLPHPAGKAGLAGKLVGEFAFLSHLDGVFAGSHG